MIIIKLHSIGFIFFLPSLEKVMLQFSIFYSLGHKFLKGRSMVLKPGQTAQLGIKHETGPAKPVVQP